MRWLLRSDSWSWPGSYSSWWSHGFGNEGIHSIFFNNSLLLNLGLIVLAPLLSLIEREHIDHIRLLLLNSLMLLLFLLGIVVLLSFVEPVHLSVKGKLISSTLLLLKNVSGPYPNKSYNFCNSSFPSLIRPDGSIACSPTDKANLFGSYFSANSSLSISNAPDPPTQPLSNPIPSIIISARWVLRSLKTDKASGPDGIPPRFLKEFADELAPVLCRLFCLILISCTYPSWKYALVQHVPKKGDRSNPSNYCPIALTSGVAKVFEILLNSHFKHIESNNLLSDHQYGFRKARSTGDHLSYLTHVWSSSLRNFGESFVVALDISKAFDRVWHKALLAKLPGYGFTPSFCKLISNFLSNHFISVVVDGATSASFPVSSGVPQGSVLSPTVSSLYKWSSCHCLWCSLLCRWFKPT